VLLVNNNKTRAEFIEILAHDKECISSHYMAHWIDNIYGLQIFLNGY
jgi:hypothetical protein